MTHQAAEDSGRAWVQLALVPVLFYLGAKLSLAFAVLPEVLVMLWIPNSMLLAALLHYHWRRYHLFAAAIIIAEIAADYPTFSLIEAVLFGMINLLEATTAYALLRRWRFDPRFATPNDIAKFVVAGPVIGALLSACAAVAVYSSFRLAETSLLEFLRTWWFSDGLGLLILTPLVLSLWPPAGGLTDVKTRLRWYDVLAILAALAVISAFALSHERSFYGLTVRAFLLIPPVLYAAARFSRRTASMVVVAVSGLILYLTKNGQQPFGDLPIRETVTSAQEVIFVMSIMALGFSGLLSQYRTYTRDLEMRVEERTAELRAANRQLEELAVTDALTGLLNRRALFDTLEREIVREQRRPHGLAVIVFDLDHFKEVNDRYGHAVGDVVLRRVAAVARGVVRDTDALARYGGEEFVVVAPETSLAGAQRLAERLRLALRSLDVTVNHHGLRVTASFGVAVLGADEAVPEQILQRADQALYGAKAAGRDRVVAAGPRCAPGPMPALEGGIASSGGGGCSI